MNNSPNFILQMSNISKTFDNKTFANNKVNLSINQNSVHGLLGENGAGKSTLMSILFGLYNADEGEIFVRGKKVNIKNPIHAQKLGIGMVHQHFKLVGIFNSIENITLGNENINKIGFLEKQKSGQKIEALSKKYNFNIDLKKPVDDLSVGQQQKVEILKVLYKNPDIIIFDEPTAILSPNEIDSFLQLVKELKKSGKTIVLITHKLEEIKSVCDEATILRKGEFIKQVKVKNTSTSQMVKLMLGKEVHSIKNKLKDKVGSSVLEINNLTSKKLENISLNVNEGEIVAIAGIEGNGQSELVNTIIGINNDYKGEIKYTNNKKVNLKGKTIKERIEMGISYVPEDRQKNGMVLNLETNKNIIINQFYKKPYSIKGFLNFKEIEKKGKKIIKQFDIRGSNHGKEMSKSLSGGNQQKLILGRELTKKHKLLVVCQPTRGLDFGSINNIHKFLIEEKEKRNAVLLVSYELSEIFDLADKIIVFFKGKVAGELPISKANKKIIGNLMLKGKR